MDCRLISPTLPVTLRNSDNCTGDDNLTEFSYFQWIFPGRDQLFEENTSYRNNS